MVGKTWRLSRNEASELGVSTVLKSNFVLSFELLHPRLHEMHILEHAPVTLFGGLLEHNVSVFFLTLTHRNVSESTGVNGLVVCETNLLHIRSWVDTREQNEEDGCLRLGFLVKFEDVERWLLNELNA